MTHETPTIEAKPRDRVGTRYARRLRNEGRLPAVIYGHGIAPAHIHVDETETIKALHHGAHVFNVTLDGSGTETCLVKDLQFGYLGDNIVHIDFARVDLDEEVEVLVHLHFVGEAPVAKEAGAIVSHTLTSLEVTCKVNAIPEEIRVDLSKMDGTVLTVGELELPGGLRTELPPDTPVVTVSYRSEEEAEGEEAEVLEEGAEPEVITESREEETED